MPAAGACWLSKANPTLAIPPETSAKAMPDTGTRRRVVRNPASAVWSRTSRKAPRRAGFVSKAPATSAIPCARAAVAERAGRCATIMAAVPCGSVTSWYPFGTSCAAAGLAQGDRQKRKDRMRQAVGSARFRMAERPLSGCYIPM